MRFLRENIGWKLLSLLLAVAFWFAIVGDPELVTSVPALLRLRFERRVSNEVPVHIRFSGSTPDGYRVLSQEVTPSKLKLLGPESRVNRIEFVETDSIDLAARTGVQQFQVNTVARDPQVRFESSPAVEVKISLEKIPQKDGVRDGGAAVRH